MKSWGVDFGWYRQLWDESHGRLPAHGFMRLGRPPRYVVEAGRSWGIDRHLTPPDLPTEENVAHWDEVVVRQMREMYGSQLDALRTLHPPKAAAAERVFDVMYGLAGELRALGARFKPGHSMTAKDYEELARGLSKGQSRLASAANRERQALKDSHGLAQPRLDNDDVGLSPPNDP